MEITIFPALFVNACIGSLFALCAADRLRVDGPFVMPVVGLVLLFAVAIDVPILLYLHWVHPAWTWHYTVNPASLPAGTALAVVLAQCGTLLGTWYLGAHLIRTTGRRAVAYVLAAGTGLAVLATLLLGRRLGAYGSYEAFGQGQAVGLMQVKLGYVLIVLVTGLATAAVYVAVELARDARRVRGL